MKEFTEERIKDLLKNPYALIVKEWETYYQSQLNSLGQQANQDDPFAQRFLSDLGNIDYQVNKLIENKKVLSNDDYINQNESIDSLIELAKETNSPSILESLYNRSKTFDYGDDGDKYMDLITLKEFISKNENLNENTINSLYQDYSKRGGFYYNNGEDTIMENLIKNQSLSIDQRNNLNEKYQNQKESFNDNEISRDKAEAQAGDMDYIAAQYEKFNNKEEPSLIEEFLENRKELLLEEIRNISSNWFDMKLNENEDFDYPFYESFDELISELSVDSSYDEIKDVHSKIIESLENAFKRENINEEVNNKTNEKEFDAFDSLDEYSKVESKNKNNQKH